jgi:hypothetical protein
MTGPLRRAAYPSMRVTRRNSNAVFVGDRGPWSLDGEVAGSRGGRAVLLIERLRRRHGDSLWPAGYWHSLGA